MSSEDSMKGLARGSTFITVKWAQSLDGRIATADGDSRWISSEEARRFAHQLRSEHDAVMVGIGTVLADDPELTVRLVSGRNPVRVIVDSKLRIPTSARVLAEGQPSRTLVATLETTSVDRAREIEKLGAEVIRLQQAQKHAGLDLMRLFQELGERGINSVLVEGGNRIITSLLNLRMLDRLVVIIAPKIIGQGIDAVGDLDISRVADAITFASVEISKLGPDVVVDARSK
jgi:diaminohydroxyphosphoribosylaminopyrimidine deaminase/5-amino-6-(5-phosphoribosylamino)uracil reductase